MSTRESLAKVQSLPPSLLTAEVAISSGWGRMGNREVAREAAAKGHHLGLAITFLSKRLKVSEADCKDWLKTEILIWILELLKRRQVYKASHILSNIGLDAGEEIMKIFCDTCNKDLREYLGNHLMSVQKIEEQTLESWHLLNSILNDNDTQSVVKDALQNLNINVIAQKSFDWKCEVGSDLFFKSYDRSLESFLQAKYMWTSLLKQTKPNLMIMWINIQYSNEAYDFIDPGLDLIMVDKLEEIFKQHSISLDLINMILNDELNIPSATQKLILNEVSKFGIFCEAEEGELFCILRRLIDTHTIERVGEVLTKNYASINIDDFNNLLLQFCVDNSLFSVLNACCKESTFSECVLQKFTSKVFHLMVDCHLTANNLNDCSILCANILRVCKFVAIDDLIGYFNSQPLVLLCIFILTGDLKLGNVLSNKLCVTVDNFNFGKDQVTACLNRFSCVNVVLDKLTNSFQNASISFYDLLQSNADICVEKVFPFRFVADRELWHFKSPMLVQSYGYKKNVNFIFYLRQCRPSIASKIFILNQMNQYGALTDLGTLFSIKKTSKLAIRNFLRVDISASCVAFLEMINVSSDTLRIHLRVAKIIYESQKYTEKQLQHYFENIERNSALLLNVLENCVLNNVAIYARVEEESKQRKVEIVMASGSDIADAIREYDVVVKFARIHNLKLPELLLKFFAKQKLWLPFLLFVQVNDYPVDQVKRLVQHFCDSNLLEHVSHSVLNDIVIDEQKDMLMKERDSRKYFLSKIGVRQKVDSTSNDGMSSSISSTTSLTSGANSSNYSDLFENEMLDFKPNLLQILIKCHNSSDPPKALLQACQYYKNPLLAVLAASYEPDSVISNWLTWLAVSCKLYVCDETIVNYDMMAMSANSVSEMMKVILQNGFYKNLLYSFQIFLPENPLNTIMEFLRICIELNLDKVVLSGKLKAFKRQLRNTSSNCIIISTDHEMSYVNNKVWIENQALIFISFTLQHYFVSRYDQIKFLQLLCDIEAEKYFFIKCPKFKNVLLLLKYLDESGTDISVDLSDLHDSVAYKQNINECIGKLLKWNLYEMGTKLAKLENIPPDSILTQQWQDNFKIRSKYDYDFWDRCNKAFQVGNMTPISAVKFFLDISKGIKKNTEKYVILKIAYEFTARHRMPMIHEVERDMWITLFNIEDKNRKFESDLAMSAFFYTEMLDKLETIKIGECTLKEDETRKLNKAIEDMLNKNDVFQALKLEKLFKYKHPDLNILKLMFSLAEKLVLPYQLAPEERLLVNKTKRSRNLSHKQRNFLSRVSNVSMNSYTSGSTSVIYIPDNTTDTPTQDTLATLESLIDHVNNGFKIAQRILMLYRISVNIEKEYHNVVTVMDPMSILKDALENDCRNKLEVVHDFIVVYRWNKEQIADFICKEIESAAIKHATYNTDIVVLWDMNMNTDFHLVLQLLPDNCSILGTKLYSFASALHKMQTESDEVYEIKTLCIIIELLIRAHSCFTTDCNMEGITLILKKCQTIISLLLNLQNWKLMVRLLTGVGRYTEMNYVFQILRENEQFEFLLRKGFSKDSALKVALLEYLRKFCPDNKELYRMVALHFALFSEVALLWEREAQNFIKTLIEVSKIEMQNNKLNPDVEPFVLFQCDDSSRITLNKAMVNYNHAAEYHLHGGKLAKALNAARQAELIALQLSLLTCKNMAICILQLTDAQLLHVMTTKFNFPQARILAEAYSYLVDWSTVIFEQYILRNESSYLQEYLTYLPLNDNLVHDISRKYLSCKATPTTAAFSMKCILGKLSSVHMKYKLASELGFLDVLEELLEGNQLSYLKDTVWKRGYKNS